MQKMKYTRRLLYTIEIFLLLFVLIGCFRPEKLVYTYDDAGTANVFQSVAMELTPGVYQVRLKSNTQEGQSMSVELTSDTAGYKKILGNSVYVFPGQSSVDFEVYVTGGVSDAYVRCDFHGVGQEVLEELTVWRTNHGYRMLLFGLLCVIGVLEGLLHWHGQILEKKVPIRKQVIFWSLTMGILVAYIPYMTDYFSFGADTSFHLLRIEGLKESLINGDFFPVRVQSYWMYDHGSVVPSMYGDFFLLFPAFLRIIGFSLMSAYKIFVFALTVATAWIAYFSFRKCIKNDYVAVLGSLLYLLAPYRIYNIYARGAEGEYMAMTFLPLICCGMYLMYTENSDSREYTHYKWWIVVGMSALLVCHPLTAELVAAFMFVVCVVFWKKTFCKKTFIQLLQTVIWVLLISLWYLVPMLYLLGADQYHLQQEFDKNIQEAGTMLAGIFQFWPNKGTGGTTMYDYEPIQIGAAGIASVFMYVVLAVRDKRYRKKTVLCLFGLTLLALFLSTRYFPWNWLSTIPVIKSFVNSLQFPLRIMSMASVFSAMFVAVFLDEFVCIVKKENARIWVAVLVFLMVGTTLYQSNDILLKSDSIRLYTAENMGTTCAWSRNFIFAEDEQNDFAYHEPIAEDGLLWWDYEKKGTNIRIVVNNKSLQQRYLDLPLLGYKGYGVKASEVDGVAPVIAEERGAHGDLRIAVPAGYEGELAISYQGLLIFQMAEWVSIFCLLGLGTSIVIVHRKDKRHEA